MTELIYEQPLNEKIRSYLRLEFLDKQLHNNFSQDHQQRCFYPLFSLCELTERCDYRTDVLKDIDRHLHQLPQWQQQPGENLMPIAQLQQALQQAKDALQKSERFGAQLKQDRFLSVLRQRFSMPGASCSFDLPQLHFWLAKPWEERRQDYLNWCSHFDALLRPIGILLELTRATAQYTQASACAGFYQAESQRPLSLVRVKVDASYGCYPTISGHKNRYAIHFVQFAQQRHSDQNIDFQLAACT
ncbi:cell division protein ZapD [Shewanella sp. AS16]|uniref:cell division protein ZapD n=1 Tax=Shewanella sp. AS16 TaxID=2907625 RepID=UPI001F2D9C25|nr:cell division protein ZapD [Shewanella sp. AS16]MCE9687538.1 cell division protein ZapD [Shewanella sp. AS16]